jgi:hypothetical protein
MYAGPSLLPTPRLLYRNLHSAREFVEPRMSPSILDSLLCLRARNRILPILDCERRRTILTPTLVTKSIHSPLQRIPFPAEQVVAMRAIPSPIMVSRIFSAPSWGPRLTHRQSYTLVAVYRLGST